MNSGNEDQTIKGEKKIEVKRFGNPQLFSIEYSLLDNPIDDSGYLKESWGNFALIVDGKNICEHEVENETYKYVWYLDNIVGWFSSNLIYVLGYDPYPLPVKGDSVQELILNSERHVPEEDDEEYYWYHAKSSWTMRHNWFSSRGGSYLPNIYFRRVEREIEIVWDNSIYRDSQVIFSQADGSVRLPLGEFKKVIFGFLNDFYPNLLDKIPQSRTADRQSIERMWRKFKLL
ncbi:hypothetical protein LBW89_18360 [Paenibacillus sp. alder61]|uniref:Uncharacterized protein n=1 Tax=Paenibacillus faecis TaxID=862114 RepID=A0A5D0CND4_9BACL|nr:MULTISPECIES: hypothetical protein [Paenibacillus]MCA1294979.1 hypothetical protein [Paenibacillus sp. alder61]TYA10755.1 hypothetical protein FRY98_23525 [Paenibacillus faecis]